ncbi:MAG: hypothetical protein ACYCXB_05495 [Candidatus Humimicrobiaceae bacterium]
MENRAHFIEPLEDRLTRFRNNPPTEAIETLLLSIQNYFNNEIIFTVKNYKNYQTSLLFLGIHAVALTISEIFWGLEGKAGYKKFLEKFIDGDTEDTKFSLVSDKIHNWRNVLAHRWLASSGYEIQYDYEMKLGFKIEKNILIINPKIYCDKYIEAFDVNNKIWEYKNFLNKEELNNAKKRIIKKLLEN